jgi:HD-like signal output (HDOD) protein
MAPTTSEMTAITSQLPAELQASFRQRAQKLQMLPGVAVQALEIARDPECSIREFVAVVERDAKLASDILGMANSAMFSIGSSPIITLQQSIVRLGFRQCRNLILSSSMASLMKRLSLEEEWIRDVLWRHGFLTGMLAMTINKVTGAGFQGEEFAAGLMHDFGRTLIAVCFPDQFSFVDPLEFDESPEMLVAEKRVIGADHCEAGAWFAEFNRLPSEFVEVIRHHHTSSAAPKHRRLVALTSAADHMANHLQRFDDADEYDLQKNEAVFILEGTGVTNVFGRLSEMHRDMMNVAKRDAQKMWSV